MNSSILDILSKYKFNNSNNKFNLASSTINQYGDVILLTNEIDQPIVFSNIRENYNNDNIDQIHSLPLDITNDDFNTYEFTNVNFNSIGNALLLYNTKSIGLITIPKILTHDGPIIINNEFNESNEIEHITTCHFQLLSQDYLSNSLSPIVKTTFHSIHPYSVITLLENGLILLIDCISDFTQSFQLPINNKYISFTTGPSNIDWLQFTIFVLANNGEIFSLCPIIPVGITISSSLAEDLWNWIDDQTSYGINIKYLNEIKEYLNSIIGYNYITTDNSINHLILDENNSPTKPLPFRTGEEPQTPYSNANTKSPAALNALTRLVDIQGPIKIDRYHNIYSSPCDITTIASSHGDSAPIISIVYNNGDVELGIFSDNDNDRYSYIYPVWEGNIRLPVSQLVITEYIPTHSMISTNISSKSITGQWKIIPDINNAHMFFIYCSNQSGSGVYIVRSDWIHKSIYYESSNNYNNIQFIPSDVILLFTNTNTDTNDYIIGLSIIHDPLVGHICLFRLSNGSIGCININVHMKLYELQSITNDIRLSKLNVDNDDINGQSESKYNEHKLLAEDVLFQQQLKELRKASLSIPCPNNDSADNINENHHVKDLTVASQYVTEKIILPMEELGQRAMFRMDKLAATINIQRDFLEGSKSQGIVGIKEHLEGLLVTHDELSNRLTNIKSTYEIQKELTTKIYQLLMKRQNKLSDAESEYKKELQAWSNELKLINILIEKSKRQYNINKIISPCRNITDRSMNIDNSLGYTPISAGKSLMNDMISPSFLSSPMTNEAYSPSPLRLSIGNLRANIKSTPYRPKININRNIDSLGSKSSINR